MYKSKYTLLLCILLWMLPGCATDTTDTTDTTQTPAAATPATEVPDTEVPATEADTTERDAISMASRSLYAFGDSWMDLMDDEQIERELADRNLTESVELFKHGSNGKTADDWATDHRGLLSDLIEELTADKRPNPVMFVTLGGNDVLQDGANADAIAQDMQRIVEQITTARPDVHIVYGSYDVFNPAIDPARCDEMFTAAIGTSDAFAIHSLFDEIITSVTAELASAKNVTTVNAIGSLNGEPGNADPNNVSPIEYLADCIHLNDDGYSIYLDTIFDVALFDLLVR